MRFFEFKETETAKKIYAIGDSHAVAVAGTGKFISLATNGRSAMNGANDDAVGKVTPGSTVVLSAGANDMMNPNKQQVVSRISSLISALQQKDCKVFYILFAETDNPKFAQDRNQLRQMVKASLPSGVEVIDMGKLSVASGDGIHAPMGWYASASAKVKAGAKPGQAPTPTPTPTPTTASTTASKEGGFVINIPHGRVGSDVADVQKALIALGYPLPKHGVDGIRGLETITAIKKFQKDNNLTVDGDPGEQTVGILNALLKSKPDVASKLTKSTTADVKSKVADRDPGNYVGNGKQGVGETGSAKAAVSFFVEKGWTPAQAAGIVGNLQAESGSNLKTDAVGDGGKAYGIAQWHPDRQANFKRTFGKEIREAGLKDQLEFVNWELNNTEAGAGKRLKGAKTAEQAAWIMDEFYERSSGEHRQQRINNALALAPRTTTTA